MGHPVHRVKAFEIVGPYRVRMEFADGLVRMIDFLPILEGELYGPLRDPGRFNAVSLDREIHMLVWPNGADFDPATLHDWPEHEGDMIALARRWAASARSGEKASERGAGGGWSRAGSESAMDDERAALTRDRLITMALQGKDRAVAAYDEILWKIRAGYAAVLYGTFTLLVGLGDKTGWAVGRPRAGLIALVLVTGFTGCAAALDFTFLTSKLRVVHAKEQLIDLALKLVSGEALKEWQGAQLQALLHQSGESRLEIDWKARAPVWPIALLYAGTWVTGCVAVWLMA